MRTLASMVSPTTIHSSMQVYPKLANIAITMAK